MAEKTTLESLDERALRRVREIERESDVLRNELREKKTRIEELRRSNQALRILSACNHVLVSAVSESQFLNDLCRLIVDVGGYRLAWVGFARQDERKSVEPVAQAGYEEGYLENLGVSWSEESERGKGPTGTSVRTGKTVVCGNILKDPSFAPWRDEALRRGYVSSVALPIQLNGQTIGALNIYSEDADAFDANAVKLFEELAADLAFGINVLHTRSAHQESVEVLRETKDMLEGVLNSSPVGIAVVDAEGRTKLWSRGMEKMFGFSQEEALGKPLPIVPPDKTGEFGELRRRVLKGEGFSGVEVQRVRKDGTRLDISLSTAPIRDAAGKEAGVVGVLQDITEEKKAAHALTQLNEQLHALAARLQSAQEEEAKRIAREIHDEMGQLLTGLNIHLSYLEKGIQSDRKKQEVIAEIKSVQTISATLIQTVRRIASELRPAVLDDLGLVSAVEWQVQEFEAHTKIKCALRLPREDLQVNMDISTALFRILQEALTNVARHSGATEVDVALEHKGAKLLLEVRDNGTGASEESIRQTNSLGILGMRERAALFGGTVQVIGLSGRGTIVRAEIPC